MYLHKGLSLLRSVVGVWLVLLFSCTQEQMPFLGGDPPEDIPPLKLPEEQPQENPPPPAQVVQLAGMTVYKRVYYAAPYNDDHILEMAVPKPLGQDSLYRDMPVYIFVHGGAWKSGREGYINRLHKAFATRPTIFISINYALSPNPIRLTDDKRTMHPMHTLDVARSIAWVYRNIHQYGGRPDRIQLIGFSAGAHLVNLVSMDTRFLRHLSVPPKAIKGIVSIDAGPYLLSGLSQQSWQEWGLLDIWRNAFGTSADNWPMAFPGTYVSKGKYLPPVLLLHSNAVYARQKPNESYATLLRESGGEVRVIPCMQCDHGTIFSVLGTPSDTYGLTKGIREFLERPETNIPPEL